MFAVAPDLTTIGLWKAQHMVSAISQTWQKKQKFIQSSVKKDVNFLGNSNKLKNNKCSQTSSEIKTSLCPCLSSNALYIALPCPAAATGESKWQVAAVCAAFTASSVRSFARGPWRYLQCEPENVMHKTYCSAYLCIKNLDEESDSHDLMSSLIWQQALPSLARWKVGKN